MASRRPADSEADLERMMLKRARGTNDMTLLCAECGQQHAPNAEHVYAYVDENAIARDTPQLMDAMTSQPIVDCVHLSCQHAFSRKSLKTWWREKPNCPTCRTWIAETDFQQHAPLIIRSLLDNLKVYCPLCGAAGGGMSRCDLKGHLGTCALMPVACANQLWEDGMCDVVLRRCEMPDHELVCGWKPVCCPYRGCWKRVPTQSLKDHCDMCSSRPVECEVCKEQVTHESQSSGHHADVCAAAMARCTMEFDGTRCDVQMSRRDLEQHEIRECPLREVACEQRCGAVMRALHTSDHQCIEYLGRLLSRTSQELKVLESIAGVKVFSGHSHIITACCFSTGSSKFALGFRNGDVLVTDIATGRDLKLLARTADIIGFCQEGVSACCFSPAVGDRLLVGYGSFGSCLWDTSTGKALAHFSGCIPSASILASRCFSPNGEAFFTSGYSVDRSGKEETIVVNAHVAKTLNGKTTTVLELGRSQVAAASVRRRLGLTLADGAVSGCFSPDSSSILVPSLDASTAMLWHVSSGAKLMELKKHTSDVCDCCFSPDGTRILTTARNSTCILWDAGNGTMIKEFKCGPVDLARPPSSLRDPYACSFSESGRRIVVFSRETLAVKVSDVDTGAIVKTFKHITSNHCCHLSSNGSRMAVVSRDGMSVALVTTETGEVLKTLEVHSEITHTCCSRDGSPVLVASRDGTVILWRVHHKNRT